MTGQVMPYPDLPMMGQPTMGYQQQPMMGQPSMGYPQQPGMMMAQPQTTVVQTVTTQQTVMVVQ